MRKMMIGAAALALVLGAATLTVAAVSGPIAAAVADPARPQADRDLDAARKPAEVLAFIGLHKGEKVVSIFPGKDAYFEKLFGALVGPTGKVYGYLPSEIVTRFKIAAPPSGTAPDPKHPNSIILVGPINDFATPEPVDVVWIRQNYHDLHDPFMGPADMAKFNAAVFRSLKHGGEFVILDHAAPAGSGFADTNTTHRIDPEAAKKEVEAAGFKFAGQSEALRNPADPKDKLVFDPSIRGHTDQFLFKFRKP